jgi:hypothetical protein
MTELEKRNYNKMREALMRITQYESPEELRQVSEEKYGLEFEKAIEMSYDNIQSEAQFGLRGIPKV